MTIKDGRTQRILQMESLYDRFYRQLYLYALTFLSDEEEARDIVHNSFAYLWNKWQNNEDVPVVTSTYLYRLVRNQCIDFLRHDQARRNYTALMQLTDAMENPEDGAEYERRIIKLGKAVEQLEEPGKTILKCCYYEKMTYLQAADKLGLTLVIVKKNMLKVFKNLKNMLKEED